MKKIRLICSILFIGIIFLVSSCGTNNNFESWNKCDSLDTLISYVDDVTNKKSNHYIPVEDRIAVFDMDGTLYGELFPEYLEYLMLEYRLLDDPNYNASDELKEIGNQIREAGKTYSTPKVDGFDMIHARAAAEAYSGMTVEEFLQYTKDFIEKDVPCFNNLKYKDAFYKPMKEVVAYLQKNDFTTYVVSGSDRLLCRALVCDYLNIPENQIIGMDVKLEGTEQAGKDGLDYQFKRTDKLIRSNELIIKNLKMNKVLQIYQEIGKNPVISFGNSSGDESMHNYTLSNPTYESRAFMLVADDIKRDHAKIEEANNRRAKWENNYTIISMENDFKTIYGENVTIK